MIERCFKLIGYPEKRDVSKLKSNRFANNAERVDQKHSEHVNSSVNSTVLTPEVIEQLLKLVNVQNSEGSSKVNMAGVCTSTLSGPNMFRNWIIDSGATDHMVHNLSLLVDITAVSNRSLIVNLPNGTCVNVSQVGKCYLTKDIILEKVFHVPRFKFNLLSVNRVTQSGKVVVTFVDKLCFIQDSQSDTTLRTGELVNGLYCFIGLSGHACFAFANNSVTYFTWHKRFGHPSNTVLNILKPVLNLPDINVSSSCEVCYKAKQSREPFLISSHKSTTLFDHVHADVWGPYNIKSYDGIKYFLTLVDDFSRASWVFLMKSKIEVGELIEHFFALVKNQFKSSLKMFRGDNEIEFINGFTNNLFR